VTQRQLRAGAVVEITRPERADRLAIDGRAVRSELEDEATDDQLQLRVTVHVGEEHRPREKVRRLDGGHHLARGHVARGHDDDLAKGPVVEDLEPAIAVDVMEYAVVRPID